MRCLVSTCFAGLLWLACSQIVHAQSEALDYVTKLCPEVVRAFTIDDLYKAHPDAKKARLTRNSDGSQEIIWGNNLVSSHAVLADGKVILFRRKVIRASRNAAEKEMTSPQMVLGKPMSTIVPDDDADTVSCNSWAVSGYVLRTSVSRGRTVRGDDVFFYEMNVLNPKALPPR